MAETLLSPGVLARENDQSFLTAQPAQAGAAILGPTVKGPVGIPTIVTTYSDYTNKFGASFISGGAQYTYLTSISAYNYFNGGGTSLLVTRVQSGSWASAQSTFVASGSSQIGTSVFQLKTFGQGVIMNNSGSEDAQGALISGSADNLRWSIVSRDTSSGTFSLIVRRGDDTQSSQTVLETFTNLSLDPTSPNFISKVIGDTYRTVNTSDTTPYVQSVGTYPNNSSYIYVSAVNLPTPNYFDNAGNPKAQYTGSIPILQSGSFNSATGDLFYGGGAKFYENITGAANVQGIDATNYTTSIDLLSNQDDYKFNAITIPGMIGDSGNNYTQVANLVNMVQTRGDSIAVIDVAPYNSTLGTYVTNAADFNTSYAATYAPWLQTTDPTTGNLVWVPASTLIPGVYAFNDTQAEPWFAPAGLNRGSLSTVVKPERKLSQANRDQLYLGNVNPIASFTGAGTVVFGQKTLQKKASALDRVNVRRLLIALKSYISQISNNLVFEQNSIATRNAFLSQVNPYLASVQQNQGLYAFRVVMDESNNTADVIDRNQLVGQIYLQPTKTAEFIILDFNVLPTGATFPA
jgi:hypothetical protein